MSDTPNTLLNNSEAERAILGACFLDPAAVLIARRHIKAPTYFYSLQNRLVWEALLHLTDVESAIDPVTVGFRLEALGVLENAGGKDYITVLLDATPTAANVEYHAKLVRELADRRTIVGIANGLLRSAQDRALAIEDVVAAATNALTPVAVDASATDFVSAKGHMWNVLEHLDRLNSGTSKPGFTTGWPELDEKMGGGPTPGELVSVVGIPGSGKTAVAINWATNAILDQGIACAFVSAEMRMRQLIIRQLNSVARVGTGETRTGRFHTDAWQRITAAAGRLTEGDLLFIDDTPAPSIEDVAAKVTLLKQRVPALKYLFVDFMQLLTQRDRRKGDLESSALKAVAYGLQALAARLEIVVVATVQPNDKQIEERNDKRPQLRDIQGSSGIRQASHFVLLCHRPQQFDPAAGDVFEIDIAKARELQQSHVKLYWDGPHQRLHSPGRDALEKAKGRLL